MPALNINVQNVYPPRNQLVVTGLTLGDSVEIYRQVSSVRTLVRAGVTDSTTDTSFIAVDSEYPFGTPVSYVVLINGSQALTAGPTTYTGITKPVFTDAINGNAAEMVIAAWDRKSRSVRSAVFQVGSRNVVVSSGSLGMYEASIQVYTSAQSSADNFLDLLRNATGNIIQIRNAGGTVADYVSVLNVDEDRLEQNISDEKRFFILNVVQVDSWAAALAAKAFTYQDVVNYYGTATYAAVSSDYATYLAAVQGDYS